MNNEKMEQKTTEVRFTKTSVFVLPIAFILCLVIGICFFAVNDFKADLNPLVIWLFFVVVIFYVGISIFDVISRKDVKKLKYIFVVASLAFMADIFYILAFYLS